MSDPREQVKLLSEALKARDHTIAVQKQAIKELKTQLIEADDDNNKLLDQLDRQSHVILVLVHTLGPKVNIRVSNFSELFDDASIVGTFGLSEDDVYAINVEVAYSPKTNNTKVETDEH